MTRTIRLTLRRRPPLGQVMFRGIGADTLLGKAIIESEVPGVLAGSIGADTLLGKAIFQSELLAVAAEGIEAYPEFQRAAISTGASLAVLAESIYAGAIIDEAGISVPGSGGDAPTVVDSATGDSGGNASTMDVTMPTHNEGDLLFVAVAQDTDGATFSALGWTFLYDSESIDGSGSFGLAYRIAGADEPATYEFTSSESERMVYVAWSVADHNGIDAVGGTPVTGKSDTVTFPSVTTTVDNAMVFAVIATDRLSLPHSAPSGYTAIDSREFDSGASISVSSKVVETAGVETPGGATMGVSEEWVTVTLAVAGN